MSGEQDKLSVSLEPPKLFGRKKKSGKAEKAAADPAPETTDAPAAPPEPREESAPATSDDARGTEDTEVVPAAPEEPEAVPAETEAVPVEHAEKTASAPVEHAETSALPATDEAVDAPLMDEIDTGLTDEDDLAPAPATAPAAAATPAGPSLADRLRGRLRSPQRREKASTPAEAAEPGDTGGGTAYTAPMLDHYPAAALTGAIVGLGLVTLTWLSLRGCEAIRGTASCGGGPGFLLLVAMFVVSVMLGSAILKSFQVPDPGSSSFLAVGLVAVVALLFLIDALDHWSMLLVVPVISVGAYLLSVYITKTFVEPSD